MKVSAIRSTHIPGHASYRVDTPAGSVVIGGDAGNDTLAPPRSSSTSDQVEKLAKGVDIIVHSAITRSWRRAGTAACRRRFSIARAPHDLGAMAKRAGAQHLMLTHMIPPMGADRWGDIKFPARLTEADYRKAVEASGLQGTSIVGTDLAKLRLPSK